MTQKEIMNALAEITEYFRGCAKNAAPGSNRLGVYLRWIAAIRVAREEMAGMEDDGK